MGNQILQNIQFIINKEQHKVSIVNKLKRVLWCYVHNLFFHNLVCIRFKKRKLEMTMEVRSWAVNT